MIDIIVVIIIGIAAFLGMKRGLMMSLLTLCSLVICVVIAGIFAYPVSNIVISMGVSDRFQAIAIAFIILFILSCIALLILKAIIKLIHNLPVIKQLDTIGGLLLGIACGFVIVSVIAVCLHMFGDHEKIMPVIDMVNKSHIMKYFYEKNFVDLIMKAL